MSDATLLPTYNSVVAATVQPPSPLTAPAPPIRVVLPLEDIPADDVDTTYDVLEQCEGTLVTPLHTTL